MIFASGIGVASTAKTTGAQGALGVTANGVTLIRTRGHGVARMDPGAASDSGFMAIGLGLFATEAFAAGSASLPGPIGEIDVPWIWHKIISFGPTIAATETEDSILQNFSFDFDSKAMRVFRPGTTMGFVMEPLSNSGLPTFDFAVAARQLFKIG